LQFFSSALFLEILISLRLAFLVSDGSLPFCSCQLICRHSSFNAEAFWLNC